jgi:hypothetical protein
LIFLSIAYVPGNTQSLIFFITFALQTLNSGKLNHGLSLSEHSLKEIVV